MNLCGLIILLFTFFSVTSSNDIGQTLVNFSNLSVRGIYLYGNNVLGIALNNEVYVGRLSDTVSNNMVEIKRIPLDETVSVNDVDDKSLLEFKLINESTVLACTADGCSVCSNMPYSHPQCYHVALPRNPGPLHAVSAALVNDNIMLRAIRHNGNASIHYFVPDTARNIYEDRGRQSHDGEKLSDFETVAAFSTSSHSYFVGSARRKDLASMAFHSDRINTDVRITRICNSDLTESFESRIDLVLSCDGINYGRKSAITNKATAATYLPETSRLLVAFQHDGNQNFICEYNFPEIQANIANTWDQCQTMTSVQTQKKKCKRYNNFNALDDKCFLMSWEQRSMIPYCTRFNSADDNEILDNCQLHMSTSNLNRFGSLENFKPFNGNLLYVENRTKPIVAIREIPNEKALYALREDKHVIRVRAGNNSTTVLMSVPAKSGKHMLEILPKSKNVLYIPAQFERSVKYFTSSCEGIYKTCHTTEWTDPLQCVFCANDDGTGIVVPESKMACQNSVLYKNACPPIIQEASRTGTGIYHITGLNFDTMVDPEVTICDEKCNFTAKIDPTIIRCTTGLPRAEDCIVVVKAALDSNYKNIQLSKPLVYETLFTTTQSESNKISYFWRVFFWIIAALGLLGIIIFIGIWISRRGTKNINKSGQHYQQVISDIPLNVLNQQIHRDQLIVQHDKCLGRGNSATVYKGIFNISPNRSEEVAVKVFHAAYDLNIENELKVLRKVDHPNIVRFIGSVPIDNKLHIMTEYMAGGSLQDFIQDSNNIITYRNCFDYIKHVLKAMVYLSDQRIVHRDLAARNCLLNHDHTVLKVTDFGLARTVNYDNEYQIVHEETELPTRWIAIELFSLSNPTEKSDVWSFAVLVWELFMRGSKPPYGTMKEISKFLNEGKRLEQPDTCHNEIYKLMLNCWDANPNYRPTFKCLEEDFNMVINNLTASNKKLNDTEYERPTPKAFTPNGSKAITDV